ncbi:MAG: hypothetical protein KME45_18065 [Stenomitos rutilans HA7619-LM2]|jgi:serine/threonine-protein kinase|nr:hypothetical protein [Stenomitos rutilans HA7619-LM2]
MKAVKRVLAWATSACAMTTLMVVPWAPKPSLAAAPDFSITELRWWNWFPSDPWQSIQFTVPDQDTTISAYGGELRRYDIHVAKMFEVTRYLCQRNIARRTLKGFDWHYEAANGNVDMGRFKITCRLAREIITAYGLGHIEQTEINLPFDENGQFMIANDRPIIGVKKPAIPVLNITSSKVATWMSYVQTFQPASDPWKHLLVENSFPTDEVLSKIKDKTEVPIAILNHL